MPEEAFLDFGMLHLTECGGTVPLLLQMRLPNWHVVQNFLKAFALLRYCGQNTRLEEELFELDKHAAFLKALRLDTAVVDILELLKIGIFKDFLNFSIDELIEFLRRGLL